MSLSEENRDLKLKLRHTLDNGADDLLKMKKHYEAEMARLKKDHDECYEELLAAKQHVEINVAEVERLRKEAFDYRDGFMEASTELENLRELQKAAEAIEGPASWFAPILLTPIKNLHKAIRKVRGMK